MMRFIKIAVVALLAQLPLLSVAKQGYDFYQGVAYVHTVRNSPTFKMEESTGVLQNDTMIFLKNFEIKCDATQKAFIVFSNRTVMEMTPNSDITVETFEVAKNHIFDFAESRELEKERSRTQINLKRGKLRFLGLNPRPTSSFKISTPFGVFDIKSSKFIISLDEKNLKFSILNGSAIFKNNDGKERFIKGQQFAEMPLTNGKSSSPLLVEYITSIENDSIEDALRSCKMAFETVEFTTNRNGNVSAKRIVPKDFLKRLAK